MQNAPSKTRETYPLSQKKIVKKTFLASVVWVILLLIVWVFCLLAQVASALVTASIILVASLLVLLNYLYQKWYFSFYYYDLGDDFITIKKDPLTPTEITIPYERIQDVYVDQDILDRIMGLYDVHLSSATVSSGMEAHIDGVDEAAAQGLRNLLLTTVQTKIKKN